MASRQPFSDATNTHHAATSAQDKSPVPERRPTPSGTPAKTPTSVGGKFPKAIRRISANSRALSSPLMGIPTPGQTHGSSRLRAPSSTRASVSDDAPRTSAHDDAACSEVGSVGNASGRASITSPLSEGRAPRPSPLPLDLATPGAGKDQTTPPAQWHMAADSLLQTPNRRPATSVACSSHGSNDKRSPSGNASDLYVDTTRAEAMTRVMDDRSDEHGGRTTPLTPASMMQNLAVYTPSPSPRVTGTFRFFQHSPAPSSGPHSRPGSSLATHAPDTPGGSAPKTPRTPQTQSGNRSRRSSSVDARSATAGAAAAAQTQQRGQPTPTTAQLVPQQGTLHGTMETAVFPSPVRLTHVLSHSCSQPHASSQSLNDDANNNNSSSGTGSRNSSSSESDVQSAPTLRHRAQTMAESGAADVESRARTARRILHSMPDVAELSGASQPAAGPAMRPHRHRQSRSRSQSHGRALSPLPSRVVNGSDIQTGIEQRPARQLRRSCSENTKVKRRLAVMADGENDQDGHKNRQEGGSCATSTVRTAPLQYVHMAHGDGPAGCARLGASRSGTATPYEGTCQNQQEPPYQHAHHRRHGRRTRDRSNSASLTSSAIARALSREKRGSVSSPFANMHVSTPPPPPQGTARHAASPSTLSSSTGSTTSSSSVTGASMAALGHSAVRRSRSDSGERVPTRRSRSQKRKSSMVDRGTCNCSGRNSVGSPGMAGHQCRHHDLECVNNDGTTRCQRACRRRQDGSVVSVDFDQRSTAEGATDGTECGCDGTGADTARTTPTPLVHARSVCNESVFGGSSGRASRQSTRSADGDGADNKDGTEAAGGFDDAPWPANEPRAPKITNQQPALQASETPRGSTSSSSSSGCGSVRISRHPSHGRGTGRSSTFSSASSFSSGFHSLGSSSSVLSLRSPHASPNDSVFSTMEDPVVIAAAAVRKARQRRGNKPSALLKSAGEQPAANPAEAATSATPAETWPHKCASADDDDGDCADVHTEVAVPEVQGNDAEAVAADSVCILVRNEDEARPRGGSGEGGASISVEPVGLESESDRSMNESVASANASFLDAPTSSGQRGAGASAGGDGAGVSHQTGAIGRRLAPPAFAPTLSAAVELGGDTEEEDNDEDEGDDAPVDGSDTEVESQAAESDPASQDTSEPGCATDEAVRARSGAFTVTRRPEVVRSLHNRRGGDVRCSTTAAAVATAAAAWSGARSASVSGAQSVVPPVSHGANPGADTAALHNADELDMLFAAPDTFEAATQQQQQGCGGASWQRASLSATYGMVANSGPDYGHGTLSATMARAMCSQRVPLARSTHSSVQPSIGSSSSSSIASAATTGLATAGEDAGRRQLRASAGLRDVDAARRRFREQNSRSMPDIGLRPTEEEDDHRSLCKEHNDNVSARVLPNELHVRGDLLAPCALPTLEEPHRLNPNIRRVSTHTVAGLLRGEKPNGLNNFFIVDCRFPFEHDGGRIIGARNWWTREDVLCNFFVKPMVMEDTERVAIIFHCEFSSHRAPSQYAFMREVDLYLTREHPNLIYPEMYVMAGGYKQFFHDYPEFCTPQTYMPMKENSMKRECDQYEQRLAHSRLHAEKLCKWKTKPKIQVLFHRISDHGLEAWSRHQEENNPTIPGPAGSTEPMTPQAQVLLN